MNKGIKKREELEAENDFMKMKIMLERGGTFGGSADLPPEVENQFLKNIIEFEKQYQERKMVKIYEKIGRPSFVPVGKLNEEEILKGLETLNECLEKHGISVSVVSPNVKPAELYKFLTEELFEEEIADIDIPGMMNMFTYDEFHPDHKFENTNIAVEECIEPIFRKEPMQWMMNFKKEGLKLNDHFPLTENEFQEKINCFKNAYENIELDKLPSPDCRLDDKVCVVKGSYNAVATLQHEKIPLTGTWMVKLDHDEEMGYWYVCDVQVQGMKF